MQVPEKLSLIGGSILLASTLVFTLKSQASDILPKVDSGMSSLVHADNSGQSSSNSSQSQQQAQQQEEQNFDSNFQKAKEDNQTTGMWGSAKYYIDKDMNMHVGSGELSGTMYDAVGGTDKSRTLNSLNIDGQIKAPSDSHRLFSTLTLGNMSSINGLDKVDTSQVTDMGEMFLGDNHITSIPGISNWNTSNVRNMAGTFNNATSLTSLNVSQWDTHNVGNTIFEFWNDTSLQSLKMNNWDTSNVSHMNDMFDANFSLNNLELGDKTYIKGESSTGLQTSSQDTAWKNNNQALNTSSITDGSSHPGTWIKQ